ncbi:MAG: BlaI/MecI/CopY family transcriptional regulator [Bacteroidales bacterium]|jgi:predicted transcriptional regulator|nr:BlaI/MecI/CopY family transcriptional regulator [Bacteroidales bacterium]MBO7378932.1 BlaI/MecI/CopY family transcriptional regulator [Bacteroidales bacterium]MBP5213697.1 BlaI/MecI/CopY family transcriptional regulator [Bacteroidales bacterium]MBP5763953.1 BlaI/MecI/CopY family transcriptional regulator [Bacteroidales bacterium]
MKQDLTAKEEEAMNIFWEHGPQFVKEMLNYYEEPKPHFNTLSTVVRTLEEKGYVAHKAVGGSHQYYAAISAEQYHKKTLTSVIGRYFRGSYVNAISALVKEEDISIDELKSLIEQVEKGKQP